MVGHAAHIQDRDGAKLVLAKLVGKCPRLKRSWADGGYAGQWVDWVLTTGQWVLAIVKRAEGQRGFQVLPTRWGVERTRAWLGR